jgi:hypothetical protein
MPKTIERIKEYLLYIIIILIPFSVRYVFDWRTSTLIGQYSDFTALSLYLLDFVLVGFIALAIFSQIRDKVFLKESSRNYKVWIGALAIAATWLVLELIFQTKDYFTLQLYFSARIILLLVFTAFLAKITVSRERIAWLFTILGSIQGLIASYQFYWQKSVGLFAIGESPIGPSLDNVAKIVSHGTKLIRSYGTFPHPNILAAFLVATTVFNLYLLNKTTQNNVSRGTLYLLLLVNVFGLFLTFSRGGIAGFIVALAVLTAYFLLNKQFSRGTQVIAPALIAIGISTAILWPHLSSRSAFRSDPGLPQRMFYNDLSLKMFKDKPIFGVGPNTSMLHMKQYSPRPLESWEIQPIHNYYLLSLAEWGIGAISFLFLLLFPIFVLFKQKIGTWDITLSAIIVPFLLLGFLDHYFYTIWPSAVLIWLILGIIYSNVSRETI